MGDDRRRCCCESNICNALPFDSNFAQGKIARQSPRLRVPGNHLLPDEYYNPSGPGNTSGFANSPINDTEGYTQVDTFRALKTASGGIGLGGDQRQLGWFEAKPRNTLNLSSVTMRAQYTITLGDDPQPDSFGALLSVLQILTRNTSGTNFGVPDERLEIIGMLNPGVSIYAGGTANETVGGDFTSGELISTFEMSAPGTVQHRVNVTTTPGGSGVLTNDVIETASFNSIQEYFDANAPIKVNGATGCWIMLHWGINFQGGTEFLSGTAGILTPHFPLRHIEFARLNFSFQYNP